MIQKTLIIPKNKLQGLKAHFKSEKDPLTDKPIEIKFTFNEFAKVEADCTVTAPNWTLIQNLITLGNQS